MMYSSKRLMTSVTSPAPFATAVTLTKEPFLPEQERTMTRFSAFWVSFWKLALVTLALFALPISSGAGVIVSVTDLAVPVNRAAFFLGGEFSNVVAASWTQNESFSGVTIDASIVTSDSSFRNGTAYLMSMIGPGTTPASEIVPPVSFTAPFVNELFGEVPLTVLFSGLNLSAGTYYLVLTAPFANFTNVTGSPLTWQIATTPDIITAPSVSIGIVNSTNSINSTVDPFAPASLFLTDGDALLFDVVSNVPEPQNAGVVLIMLVALLLGVHKVRNSRGATRNSGDAASSAGIGEGLGSLR